MSMQALLQAAFGLMGAGGEGQTITSLEREGESVKETFLQPQPVGLTNIQAKVIGPYFTRNPTHHHPEATVDKAFKEGKISYQPPADFLAQVTISDDGVMGAVHLCLEEVGTDSDTREMELASLCSMLPDPEKAFAAMEEGTEGSKIILQEALRQKDDLDDDSLEMLHSVLCAAPVKITGQPFGHAPERALSISLVGSDCHWNVINKELIRCFESEEMVEAAVSALGVPETVLSGCKDYLSTGLPLPPQANNCIWFFAAQILQRTIVVYGGPRAPTTFIFLPTSVQPEKVSSRPLLIHDEGTGKSKSAIVAVKSITDSLSKEVNFKLAPVLVAFPFDKEPSDFLKLSKTEDGSNTVLLNPPCSATRSSAEKKHCDPMDDEVSRAELSSSSSPTTILTEGGPEALGCNAYIGHDPKALSFESFPSSYFALADTAEVAKDLLGSSGFGIDESGSAEYLATALSFMHNLSPVHVDADGHCLTHSISRCLIGKEYLWHALRYQLWLTLKNEKEKYLEHFKKSQFLTALDDEMDTIIERASPDYCGEEGSVLSIGRGLGTEHIFVLANILKRPILLLDVPGSNNAQGFLFLPLLVEPEKCTTKKVIVLGWNNSAHQHYVPVVPVDGSLPAAIPDAVLPRSIEDKDHPDEYLVYGCPDDVKPSDLVNKYLEFVDMPSALLAKEGGKKPRSTPPPATTTTTTTSTTSGGEQPAHAEEDGIPQGPIRHILVGGESRLDSRAWCQGVCEIYQSQHSLSIWAMHEVCRYLLKARLKGAQELACIKDIDKFDELCVSVAKEKKLYYCPVCTGTTDSANCSASCQQYQHKPRLLDVRSGRPIYKQGDRMPHESTIGYSCCVYKHWCENKEIGPGSFIFARDAGSAFQLGQIEKFNKGSLSDGSDTTYDIRFRAGNSSAVRYCCPMEDILFGFPTDCHSLEETFSAGGLSTDVLVVWDANDKLRMDPKTLVPKVIAGLKKKAQAMRIPLTASQEEMLQRYIILNVDALKKRFEQRCASRARLRGSMGGGGAGGGAGMSPGRMARGTNREKKYEDSEGRTMLWQSKDPMTGEWIDYDHESTGILEGAYQDGVFSQELNIGQFGVFTVHFRSWFQENTRRGGRSVRRVALSDWACPICTFENPSKRPTCEMCQGPRSDDAFKVVGDESIQKDLDAAELALGDDDEVNIKFVEEKQAEMEEKCRNDDRLKVGGSIHEEFYKASTRNQTTLVHHLKFYYGWHFLFWEPEQRWVPIPYRLTKGHLLYDYFKSGICKEMPNGWKMYTKSACKFLSDKSDDDDAPLLQVSDFHPFMTE